MSGADLIVLGLIALAVGLAIRAVRQGRTGGCGGDCGRCRGDCAARRK